MAKLSKKAEIIEKLHELVGKQAEEKQANAQSKVVGKPGADTDYTRVSDGTETTDKNNVGPEHLNSDQGYEQKPSSDGSEPSKAKTAADLAAEVLNIVNTKIAEAKAQEKQAKAQEGIVGLPGKDTTYERVSDATETTDKNNVGPDKLNGEQGYKQEPSKSKDEPSKATKTAAEIQTMAEKIASYELGKQLAETLLKQAGEQQTQDQTEILKEAGRRDFDVIIAQAAAELEHKQAAEYQQALAIKQAEDLGARAFDDLYKQAQLQAIAEDNNQLKAKVAELSQVKQQEQEKIASEQREAELAQKVAAMVIAALKSESATK